MNDDLLNEYILLVVYHPSVILQLSKDQCTESFEKSILRLLKEGQQNESRDVEKNLRYRQTGCPCLIMGVFKD